MAHNRVAAEKISLLITQSRYGEAERLCKELITQHPEESIYKYFLAQSLKYQGKLDDADTIADILLESDPSMFVYIQLKAEIDIDQERLVDAEEKVLGLLEAGDIDDENYQLLAQIKFKQNNYDKSLEYLDLALEENPENIDALNMRATVASLIGDPLAEGQVREALNLDPNNAYAIANHATQLLNDGKVEEALERYKEALLLEPENAMAVYGLKEAMKSKFPPYRWLYQYGLFMARLSGKNSWTVIIGAYLIYRFLIRTAENNPSLKMILYPLAGLMFLAFISTWILEPIMNFTLLTNEYGKLVLDEDEKKSAKLTGTLLIMTILSVVLWLVIGSKFMIVGLAFLFMMLPAGTFLSIKGQNEKKALYFGSGLIGLGLVGILVFLFSGGNMNLLLLFGAGIFIYQFVINSWMISMHGRTFGD